MKFGYARVSTRDQNLEAQLDALNTAGCDKIITEKASGNGCKERQELDRLVENLWEGDVLVVYKLDRLGRSTFKLLGLTEELQQRYRQGDVPHAGRPG
jgi:DNA invertase Pin-like site-specific DNA recombinase